MRDLLLAESSSSSNEADDSSQLLANLGAYLTLDKAVRLYGFKPEEYDISNEQAAKIAMVFAKFDANDDGVLSEDEFRRLCGGYAPDLSTPEIKAALECIDSNKDGSIQFSEFVRWWRYDASCLTTFDE
jgi:calmodulin